MGMAPSAMGIWSLWYWIPSCTLASAVWADVLATHFALKLNSSVSDGAHSPILALGHGLASSGRKANDSHALTSLQLSDGWLSHNR